jgi:multiple sugar transport system ATP-binding protein
MGEIVLTGVTKEFTGGVLAVDDVSLHVRDGEFLVFVGPSGCGKSTLLRLIAGLEEATDGTIEIGGRDVTDLPPKSRDIAMVFQDYALYPQMTVEKNLGFGLTLRKTPKEIVVERVQGAARVLGLGDLLARKPAALSGGQRQRVAIGRAMVREPAAFLMDEPLSNLDAKLRVQMRAELARLRDRLGTTTVYVTHDQVEAMTLGDRVAVLLDGVLQQIDTPQALFDHPANVFVGAFIGSPSMNLVEARVTDARTLEFGGFTLPVPEGREHGAAVGGTVLLGIRPMDFEDAALSHDKHLPTIEVTAEVVEELGTEIAVVFTVDAPQVHSERLVALSEAEGETGPPLLVHDDSSAKTRFTASIHRRSRVRPGERIRLVVDNTSLHFFDPQTGETLGVAPSPVPA